MHHNFKAKLCLFHGEKKIIIFKRIVKILRSYYRSVLVIVVFVVDVVVVLFAVVVVVVVVGLSTQLITCDKGSYT